MILSCNSCEKSCVVTEQAITAAGRMVQCGSCGNKWKQFPLKNEVKKVVLEKRTYDKKIPRNKRIKKSKIKKIRELNLYSPEYLAKKHGIFIKDDKTKTNIDKKINFGFYNSLIVFLVFIVTLSRLVYFLQDFIVQKFPFTKFYLDYFFESINNIFEIVKNLIFSY